MKISGAQLDTVLTRLIDISRNYNNKADVHIEIEITKEDPGNGIMVDCLTMKATRLPSEKEDPENHEVITTMEIYPVGEGVEPRAHRVETFKVKNRY